MPGRHDLNPFFVTTDRSQQHTPDTLIGRGLPEDDWWVLAAGLLQGLVAIHDRGITHRD